MVFFDHMTFVFSHYSAINARLVIQIYSSSFNGQLVPRQQSIVIVFFIRAAHVRTCCSEHIKARVFPDVALSA